MGEAPEIESPRPSSPPRPSTRGLPPPARPPPRLCRGSRLGIRRTSPCRLLPRSEPAPNICQALGHGSGTPSAIIRHDLRALHTPTGSSSSARPCARAITRLGHVHGFPGSMTASSRQRITTIHHPGIPEDLQIFGRPDSCRTPDQGRLVSRSDRRPSITPTGNLDGHGPLMGMVLWLLGQQLHSHRWMMSDLETVSQQSYRLPYKCRPEFLVQHVCRPLVCSPRVCQEISLHKRFHLRRRLHWRSSPYCWSASVDRLSDTRETNFQTSRYPSRLESSHLTACSINANTAASVAIATDILMKE